MVAHCRTYTCRYIRYIYMTDIIYLINTEETVVCWSSAALPATSETQPWSAPEYNIRRRYVTTISRDTVRITSYEYVCIVPTADNYHGRWRVVAARYIPVAAGEETPPLLHRYGAVRTRGDHIFIAAIKVRARRTTVRCSDRARHRIAVHRNTSRQSIFAESALQHNNNISIAILLLPAV